MLNFNLRPFSWNTPDMGYVKAFWAAVTVWSAKGHNAIKSSRAVSGQSSMLVGLEAFGDHAQYQGPRNDVSSTTTFMLGMCTSGGDPV